VCDTNGDISLKHSHLLVTGRLTVPEPHSVTDLQGQEALINIQRSMKTIYMNTKTMTYSQICHIRHLPLTAARLMRPACFGPSATHFLLHVKQYVLNGQLEKRGNGYEAPMASLTRLW
jgi:hypothetical protein